MYAKELKKILEDVPDHAFVLVNYCPELFYPQVVTKAEITGYDEHNPIINLIVPEEKE